MKHDERWMDAACEQARKGLGRTAPNPAVGCVLVRGGRIVGRGYHRKAGGPHAEIVALEDAGARARGATAYVTLEPCCHHGKTGPCTEALVDAGVTRVVAGCRDPNRLVAGKGLAALRRRGLATVVGVRRAECEDLVRGFRHWIEHGVPRVTLKLAASMDGRIAARGGVSKWISSTESRRRVHEMRAHSDAILVGIGTVLADDPRLTCRAAGGSDPLRVVLDSRLRTPVGARAVRGRGGCLIVTSPNARPSRRRSLEEAGAVVHELRGSGHGKAAWRGVLKELGRRGCHQLLVEGGAGVATSALKAGVVNELTVFYNAGLIGSDGVPMVGPLGIREPAAALRPSRSEWAFCGPDLVWTAHFDGSGGRTAAR